MAVAVGRRKQIESGSVHATCSLSCCWAMTSLTCACKGYTSRQPCPASLFLNFRLTFCQRGVLNYAVSQSAATLAACSNTGQAEDAGGARGSVFMRAELHETLPKKKNKKKNL